MPKAAHIRIGNFEVGNDLPLALIAGPCQMESEDHAMDMAGKLVEMTSRLGMGLVYKTSFDKANRSSIHTKRGLGIEKALTVFEKIKAEFSIPVLTDVHESYQCAEVARVVDVLQIPAYLCRQTDLLVAAAKTGRVVNVKKGQFLAPWDMPHLLATCVAFPQWRKRVSPLCLMHPIRSNNRAGRAQPLADSVSSFLCWPGLQLQLVSPWYSWKPMKIRIMPPLMDQTWFPWTNWKPYSKIYRSSINSRKIYKHLQNE